MEKFWLSALEKMGCASVRPFLYFDHFHIFDLFCTSSYLLYSTKTVLRPGLLDQASRSKFKVKRSKYRKGQTWNSIDETKYSLRQILLIYYSMVHIISKSQFQSTILQDKIHPHTENLSGYFIRQKHVFTPNLFIHRTRHPCKIYSVKNN